VNKKDILFFNKKLKHTFHKSTPTTQFVQRVQLSSEETVQWHKLWQLPDTNLPRQLQYHKFCSWRATISTILNNATAQYFPVATHAADTKQFKFNITCSDESQYTCFIVGYGRR
jgi:hypothetical protein